MKEQLMGAGYSASAAEWIIEQINAGSGTLDKWLFRANDLRYVSKINRER